MLIIVLYLLTNKLRVFNESQLAYMFWVQGYKLNEAHDLLMVILDLIPFSCLYHKWNSYVLIIMFSGKTLLKIHGSTPVRFENKYH
jgi:hypothetical protein